MLISSHDLEFLLEVCNRVVVLDDGQIIADGEPNPLGFQSDRVEFRTFVRYLPGAFTEDRTAHGWKTTPRMNLFAVEYMGPGITLRRVTR